MSVILSIDQSTSATKSLLWNLNGQLLARYDIPHRQITNEQGWVEHDPIEIYHNTLKATKGVLEKANIDPKEIVVIGISNQRETAVCWDKSTGNPYYNAIVWQCARATDIVENIRNTGLELEVKNRTGLNLSPYFSAAKFGWQVYNIPEVAVAKQNKRLCCGTIDSWLLFKLTGNFKTDYSNASRTQLLNLHTLQWDLDLVTAFGLDLNCLPEICPSDSLFGYTDFEGLFPQPVPIHSMLGDSHAALFGNQCFTPNSAKITYGTGSSIMMNHGTSIPKLNTNIVSSIAWGINGQIEYVLEGNINYAGAIMKWLIDDIGLIPDLKSAEALASSINDCGGVYLIPAFSGLGAPYFNSNSKAAFFGMNRNTKKEHLVRAAQEAIAYQIRDVIEAFNCPLKLPRVDGGPTMNKFLMQFQTDILGLPIKISQTEELSGMGSAFCAAIGLGLVDKQTLFANQMYKVLHPNMNEETRSVLYNGWKEAIKIINI